MRVLVNGGDDGFRMLLRLMLARLGCEAVIVPDGENNLALIETHQPQVVVVHERLSTPHSAEETLRWIQDRSTVRGINTVLIVFRRRPPAQLLDLADGVLRAPVVMRDLAATLAPFADSDLAARYQEYAAGGPWPGRDHSHMWSR